MSNVIGTRVSKTVAQALVYLAEEEHTDKATVMRELISTAVHQRLLEHALEKFARHEVSLGRAAELAGCSLADFMCAAAQRHLPLNYSPESVEKDFNAARRKP